MTQASCSMLFSLDCTCSGGMVSMRCRICGTYWRTKFLHCSFIMLPAPIACDKHYSRK